MTAAAGKATERAKSIRRSISVKAANGSRLMFMFVLAIGAIIAPISLMRWNAAVSIGRSGDTMNKDDWQNVIIVIEKEDEKK